MPYHVEHLNNEWCVVNTDTDDSVGCHDTQTAAQEHLTALYANVDDVQTMKALARYAHIDFTPNDGMVTEAKRGLEWRAEHGRGGTDIGVARARDIQNRKKLSPDTVKRMHSYFSRHEVDKQGEGFNAGEDGYPSAGRIAWALWGGDAGQAWANKRVKQMALADDSDKTMVEKLISHGGAVKALSDTRIGGYLIIWGDTENRDLYNEYFTQQTDIGLNPSDEPKPMARNLPVFYQHALDPSLKAKELGEWDTYKTDDYGLWVEAQLRLEDEYERYIMNRVKAGKMGLSSGALPQSVEVDSGGWIRQWKLIEGSITPNPAEPKTRQHLIPVKDYPIVPIDLNGGQMGGSDEDYQLKQTNDTIQIDNQTKQKELDMWGEKLKELLRKYGLELDDAQIGTLASELQIVMSEVVDESTDSADKMEMIEETVKALKSAMDKVKRDAMAMKSQATAQNLAARFGGVPNVQSQAPAYTPSGDTYVTVGEPIQYSGVSTHDLIFAKLAANALADSHSSVRNALAHGGQDFNRVLSGRIAKDATKGDGKTSGALRHYGRFSGSIKANEVMTSLASGGGADWLGVLYSDRIWERVRDEQIFRLLISKGMLDLPVPDGAGSVVVMLEGTDPTFYTVPQLADVDDTGRPAVNVTLSPRPTTSNVSFTPKMLANAVAYTDVLELSSVIPMLTQYGRQIEIAAAELMTALFLNGDTETGASANINLIDGTPATGTSTPYYIAANGARKYALVTGSGTSRDGGALSASDYLETRKLLPTAIQTRVGNQLFIVDTYTGQNSLDLLPILTRDVAGDSATMATGTIPFIYGTEVTQTGFLPKTNTAGKVSATPSNNAKGTILCVYAPYWAFVSKRGFELEVQRDALTKSTVLVGSLYAGYVARGAGAATASYNVTI